MPCSEDLKRGESAFLIPRKIVALVQRTSITFTARTRPRCRSPIFTQRQSKQKELQSIRLKEFPIISAKYFKQLEVRADAPGAEST